MARYIDADGLLQKLPNDLPYKASVKRVLVQAPTADAEEVRRGYWVDCIETGTTVAGITNSGFVGYKCSLCGRYEGKKEPYCNCGAKMDGTPKERGGEK